MLMATGYILVEAPHSALNNAGTDASERTENIVRVKAIRKGREIYPYVSAQAWRYWWRMTLKEKFGWELSPVIREEKIAFTEANPFVYPDDDIFGYMRAVKEGKKDRTVTRVSPLKCSPLVSVLSFEPVQDFGVMARQGDPVPYEHEFYSTVLQGIFSLDISRAGVFYTISQAGFRNIDEELLEKSIVSSGAKKIDDVYILPSEIRAKRCYETILALAYIYGGAKQTQHLTDVVPRLVLLAIVEGGNHIFMNLSFEDNGKVKFNFDAFERTLADYADIIRSDVYVGVHPGFIDGLDKEFKERFDGFKFGDKEIKVSTPKQAIEKFAEIVRDVVASM
jgi:CRISPR-associated protein Cst2